MKLRKPCIHGFYDAHTGRTLGYPGSWQCPGGVFLPDDALVIEKVEGEWPEWVQDFPRAEAWLSFFDDALRAADALSVREAE